jgi:hypothetical protein
LTKKVIDNNLVDSDDYSMDIYRGIETEGIWLNIKFYELSYNKETIRLTCPVNYPIGHFDGPSGCENN